jgi:predicted aldo/keto reductase-like oxidoreductase
MKKTILTRRNFIRNSSLSFIGAGFAGKNISTLSVSHQEYELPKIKNYRTLGRTGFKVSDISCGMFYNENLLKTLIKSGVNYIDTSEIYGNGNSEITIGKAIKEFDRESLFITTKIYYQNINTKDEVIQHALESLKRLDTDYIDCYMLFPAQDKEIIKSEAFHGAVEQLKKEGKIKYAGVACHGSTFPAMGGKLVHSMEEILTAAAEDGRFDVILMVYNFLQEDTGKRIIQKCADNNVGITVMKSNPVYKYQLFQEMVENIKKEGKEPGERGLTIIKSFEEQNAKMNEYITNHHLTSTDEFFRDIATKFVLDESKVGALLITFNTFDQIEQYLNLSGQTLTSHESAFLKNYVRNYGFMNCRLGCGICESACPQHLPINTIMRYNYYFAAKGLEKYAMQQYHQLQGNKPDRCTDCEGFCEKACPYQVMTKEILMSAHHNLTIELPYYT